MMSSIKEKFSSTFNYVKQITIGKQKEPYIDIAKKNLSVNDLIILLRLIGSVNVDEKINIQTLEILKNSYFTSFIRTIVNEKNEGKKETLEFIHYIINDAFENIRKYSAAPVEEDKSQIKNLIKAIKISMKGMYNIKTCYSYDKPFACFIDSLIEDTILTKLKELEISNPELFDVKGKDGIKMETKMEIEKMEEISEKEEVYERSEFDEL